MDPIKRILVLAPTPFFADRGCHMHIAEQAYALQRLGYEVEIVTYHLGRDLPDLTVRRTWTVPWYKKLGPGPSWHKFYVDPLLFIKAWQVAKKFKPDIIHAHLHEGCILAAPLSRLLGIPFIFDMQGSLTGELIAHNFPLARPPLRSVWYALERWIDHLPHMTVVQSPEMQTELINHFKVSSERIVMTYDGVNTNVFRPGGRDPELVKKFKIPANKKTIVYLGGLSPHKGVDILLDAFPLVLKRLPDAQLLLMGYPNEEHYRQRIQDMGLSNAVTITGRVPYEEAPRYLTLGDIAVAPKRSQTEANGKIYNYMAAGLPTVAFDTLINRDILGDLGAYVRDLNDIEGLASSIVKLLSDSDLRKSLAGKIRNKAVQDYSWDKVAQRIVVAYEKARASTGDGAA